MKKWLKAGLAAFMLLNPIVVYAEESESEEIIEAGEEDVEQNAEEVTEVPETEQIEHDLKDAATYTIIYIANGGTFWDGSEVYTEIINTGEQAYNLIPDRDGYIFEGWYTDPQCSANHQVEFPFYPTSDMYLYAKWSRAYVITYVLNGGRFYYDTDWLPETFINNVRIGESTYLYSEVEIIKPGYYLEGWYFDTSYTRKAGTKQSEYDYYAEYTPTSNVTLYAKWVEAYKITLHSGRGQFRDFYDSQNIIEIWVAKGQSLGSHAYMRYDYGEPIMNGKAFAGWYSSSSLSEDGYVGRIDYAYYDENEVGLQYQELYNYYPDGDMDLYAKFADAYFITFDANGGMFPSYGENVTSITLYCEKGRPFYLSYELPMRAGYECVGWSRSRNGSTGIFRTWGYIPTSNETFYMIWEKTDTGTLFVDVMDPGTFYYDAVYWALAKDITKGTSPTTFSPNQTCTRAQIVTFLWRAMGSPEPRNNPGFSDVSASRYYYKAVAWAKENGITTGTSPTKFSPDAPCTRAQIVTFLWRAMGSPNPYSYYQFSDVRSSDYFYKAVAWAKENGVTTGTSATKFSPNTSCTRAQCVTFLYRAFAD